MTQRSVSSQDSVDLDPALAKLVAVGVIAGDLSPLAIARFAEVSVTAADEALQRATAHGLIRDGAVDDNIRSQVIAVLDRQEQAAVHAAVARHLFAEGPDQLSRTLHHIRAAGILGLSESMATLADQGGRLNLSLGRYQAAYELLKLSDELDTSTDLGTQGRRLCDLATATDGLGRVDEARDALARAVALGELAGDAALVARAAVMHTLPVDWFAGHPRTSAFLQRASSMEQTRHAHVALQAARALTEIRIPLSTAEGQQYAWVARPSVAQPLAEQALADSTDCHPEVQCLCLIAWRTTHRSPRLLHRRRDLSAQTLDLAQELRLPPLQVEGAVWHAVDAIESGDRGLYDEALSVARWVSYTDGNPRLIWRADTLGLGAAFLDDDQVAVERLRHKVRALSEGAFSPGRFAMESFFNAQDLISRDDPEALEELCADDDHPLLVNAVARTMVGYAWARTGHHDRGLQFAWRAFRQIDDESSYLFVATRLAAIAQVTRHGELASELISILTPWADHVSVDGNGWWCDGPVSLWLAILHQITGDFDQARRHLDGGEAQARMIHDVRSLRRVTGLRDILPPSNAACEKAMDLTPRELAVLELLATGATNPMIARALAYSLSTIRNDTIAIYRKMGVNGRPEAVARALSLGLVAPAV